MQYIDMSGRTRTTWVASWYLEVPGELKMLSGMYKTLEELEQAVYKVS